MLLPLQLPASPGKMLAAPEDQETRAESWWARLSLLHYSVLRTITAASRQPCTLSGDQADRALWQATLEGAKGSRLLDAIISAAQTHVAPLPDSTPAAESPAPAREAETLWAAPPPAADPEAVIGGTPRSGLLTMRQALDIF